jgi:hypothetical protein
MAYLKSLHAGVPREYQFCIKGQFYFYNEVPSVQHRSVLTFGSRDRQDLSINGYMHIDSLIMVHQSYKLVISVLITDSSDN